MKIEIEIDNTKITLSVGSEGVTIDAPDTVEQETRQTTLREAQWHECAMCGFKEEEFPPFDELVETAIPEVLPPKVDPVTGDIAGWVKTYRTERRKRALEAQPRVVCVSSCCGTEGARTRDGSCWGCR